MQSNKQIDAILAIIDQGLTEDDDIASAMPAQPMPFQWPGWRHQKTAT